VSRPRGCHRGASLFTFPVRTTCNENLYTSLAPAAPSCDAEPRIAAGPSWAPGRLFTRPTGQEFGLAAWFYPLPASDSSLDRAVALYERTFPPECFPRQEKFLPHPAHPVAPFSTRTPAGRINRSST